MNNVIHSSLTGLIVSKHANVNAVYGPWESYNLAIDYLELNYKIWDDNYNEVVDIPVGTTIAVYNDDSKQTVTEYWWSDNNLVLKTYGNNYLTLVVTNELGQEVTSIYLGENKVNTPVYLFPKRLNTETNNLVDSGYILYKLTQGDWVHYEDNPHGILTALIDDRCIIEWRDDNHKLITRLDLPVILLPQLTQTFYAYNNSTTPPNYLPGIGKSYLHTNWTPNDYGLEDWSLVRKGVTDEFTIEWSLTRTRISSIWEELSAPVISARWGLDGISTSTKLILYTYTTSIITELEYFETSRRYLDDRVPTGHQQVLENSYTFDNITWYKDFKGVSIDNRYCYVTERFCVVDEDNQNSGNWTYPILYANFAVDGKDGDTEEYIYSRSNTNELSDEALSQFKDINTKYSSNDNKLGGEIDFKDYSLWTDNPQGVTSDTKYEFCAIRSISHDISGNAIYDEFGDPFIWASFGEQGPDGPGLEYIYILTDGSTPTIEYPETDVNGKFEYEDDYLPKSGDLSWSDDPLEVDSFNNTLWMSLRKGSNNNWERFSEPPVRWNTFKYAYELRLTNDNCQIPSTASGTYTVEAAKIATLTKVELYLGREKLKPTDYTITPPEGYSYSRETGVAYLSDNTVDISVSYHPEFKAFVLGEEKPVASKVLSITLNRGKESYSLLCYPNSRIWYGNNEYSNTQFHVIVYHLAESGEYTEVEDLSNFKLCYQTSADAELTELNFTDNLIEINEGLSNDIILTLRTPDNVILDTEVIDGVDYSKIKGKDNEGITFDYQENINIPEVNKNNLEYIKKATKTTIHAYKGVRKEEISRIEALAYDLVNMSNVVTVVRENDSTFFINQPITADIQVLYTVYILVDNEEVEYTCTQRINLTKEPVVYELQPSIGYLVYGRNSGINVEAITFNVTASNTDPIPSYNIICLYDDLSVPLGENVNIFDFDQNILDYIKNLTDTVYLTFLLQIDGKIRDVETIPVSHEPDLAGFSYSIDLSNPYVQLPIGLDASVVSEWTKNVITVYQGSLNIPYESDQAEYPNFSVSCDSEVSNLVAINGATTNLKSSPNESCMIHFTITVNEDANTHYSFIKSQQVLLVNSVVYSLISNPTSVVTSSYGIGSFTYTPTVLKIVSGKIETVSDLEAEGLHYKVEDKTENLTGESTEITYSYNTSTIHVGLYKGDYLYDYDTIAIVRNGEDGLSTKVVYGRSHTGDGKLIEDTAEGYNAITDYNGGNFDAKIDEIQGPIKWSDDPLGVSENYPLEFISQSIKTNGIWEPFSKPAVFANFGQKGEDGEGIEYLYTACSGLTVSSGTPGGFTVNGGVTNQDGKEIEGCTLLVLTNDYEIPGWYDNIPDLTKERPNLYMTMRRKIGGKWGYYSLPVLWNLYSSKLDLFIDNDNIIIDDNSDDATVKTLSNTTVYVTYCGSTIENPDYDVSLSDELSPPFYYKKEGNKVYLAKNYPKEKLSEAQGLVTYSYVHEPTGDKITRKLSVYIKNFSAGEGYKLTLLPNIVLTTVSGDEYKWEDTVINVSLTKIHGSESTAVDIKEDLGLELVVNNDILESGTSEYTISGGQSSTLTPFVFNVLKSGVIVDSLTVSFSVKGAKGDPGGKGDPGETPLIMNLTNDGDSIIINNETTLKFTLSTTVEAYYGSNNVSDQCSNWSFGNPLLSGGISYESTNRTINFTVQPLWYKDNKSTTIPLNISCWYNGKTYTSLQTYHLYAVNDIVKRELVPSCRVIKWTGTGFEPHLITCGVRIYRNGSIEDIEEIEQGSGLSLTYNDSSNTPQNIERPGTQITLGTSKLGFVDFTLKLGEQIIDYERIPVVTNGEDGKNGDNGENGKNAYINMRGEWMSGIKYYCNTAVSGSNALQTDVVSFKNGNIVEYYAATLTHTSDWPNSPLSSTSHWIKVAFSELMLTLELLITDGNNITGGFVDINKALNNNTGDGIILWAGASGSPLSNLSAEDATFKVTKNGVIYAKEGLFEGMYYSKTSIINDINIDCSGNIDLKNIIHNESASDPAVTIPRLINVKSLTESMWFNLGENTYIYPDGAKHIGTIKTDDSYPMYEDQHLTLKLPSGCILPPAEAISTEQQWIGLKQYFLASAASSDWIDSSTVGLQDIPSGEYSANYHYLSAISDSLVDSNISNVSDAILEKHRLYLMLEFINALPYVGKKLTLINFKGILLGILTSETIEEHKNSNFSPSLARYLAFGYDDKINSTNESIITVECKIGALGDITSDYVSLTGGYYIYWEKIFSEKSGVYYQVPEELPVFTIPVRN